MKIPSLLTNQFAKIDVHGSAESVPTGKALWLLALDVPKRITHILKIELHTALEQARPLAAPVSEEMAVRTLTCLVAVRAGRRFFLRRLRVGRNCKCTEAAP